MKIHDISQEVFSCAVYPGDDAPAKVAIKRIYDGATYNLTNFSMCAHNGTHVDAPFHFLNEGATVEQIPLTKTVGYCYVAYFCGQLCASDVQKILQQASALGDDCHLRILFKGDARIDEQSAIALADAGVQLVGVESQSVGDASNLMAVHEILLQKQVVLLEGLRLANVTQGKYFLCAQPLALAGLDGAPTRAILIEK